MGQHQSRTKSGSVIIVDNFPTYEDRMRGGNINSIVNNEDGANNLNSFCCVKNPRKSTDDNKWKKMMIEQLDSLDLMIWPKSLSKFLKKYDSDAGLPFQEDVAYAYRNHMVASAKRTMLMQSVYTQFSTESFVEDSTQQRSMIESKSILQLSERKYADEAVQGIVESSHILDEKFYEGNNRETWMTKSFNITPEHTQAMNDTVRKLKPKTPNKNSFKKTPKLPEVYMNSGRLSGGTKKHIEKYKHNTFINQLPTAGRPNLDEADELYQNVRKYKTVTEKIEQHTKQKRNVFNQLIEQFTSYLYKSYNPIILQAKKSEVPITQLFEYIEKVTTDVQQFIRIIFEGLCSYYRLDSLDEIIEGKETLFTRDNLINFTTSIVFTNSISDIVFEFFKLEEAQVEKEYQKNLKLCKTLQPQDFGVPDEYCLNEMTLKYFLNQGLLLKQIIEKNASPKAAENDGFYLDYSVSFEEYKLSAQSTQESLMKKNSQIPEETQEDLFNNLLEKYNKLFKDIQPFDEGVKVLQNLKHRQSPIHKLKSIVKVAEIISKNIERFYGDFGVVNNKKLDADQTLSIFLYVVAKSGLCDIVAHCRIIERFSTNNVLNSVSGYYATTLQACVNCIQTMSFKDNLDPNKPGEEFREMMRSVKMASVEKAPAPENEVSE